MERGRDLRDDLETLHGYDASIAPHVRRMRYRAITYRLHESLLFIPVLLLAASLIIEETLAALDRRIDQPPFGLNMPPDGAIALLSTIAGATITTAGVVFSLLVVSLQLASGQFSPRVLRTFWRDRFGQVLIGLLLATFTFCVTALTQIKTTADRAPTLTLSGAVSLTIASIVAIVAYLNRISRQQYVGRIMERIADETLNLVRELPYGPHVGMRVGQPVPPPDLTTLGAPLVVRSPVNGWVQQISRRAVVAAVPPGSVVRLETRVGAFVTAHTPMATIWPAPNETVPTRTAHTIVNAFVVGATRTMQQDIDFGLRQLNDIALRALSPAVNDPTTAIEVILRVGTVMRPLLMADLPAQSTRCRGDRHLITVWELEHVEYLAHAFQQIRLYAAPHPQVVMALGRTLRMLRVACAGRGDRQAVLHALEHELDAALAAAEKAGVTKEELAAIEAAARSPG